MADSYYFIKKMQLPFMKSPLYFKIEVFVDEIAIAQRYHKNSQHGVIYQRFKKRVANAYNTHFFREIVDPDQTYLSWLDMKKLDENNIKDIKREIKDDVQT
jgi:bifunctional pyridoxal-dependent enzyme with beta-cystathionase and maltose regulon repressor activities